MIKRHKREVMLLRGIAIQVVIVDREGWDEGEDVTLRKQSESRWNTQDLKACISKSFFVVLCLT